MHVLPLTKHLLGYLKKHNLHRRFEKQKKLFEINPFYPSLHTEILEPREWRLYSFRITGKYRAIFIYHSEQVIEIIDINNHYQ